MTVHIQQGSSIYSVDNPASVQRTPLQKKTRHKLKKRRTKKDQEASVDRGLGGVVVAFRIYTVYLYIYLYIWQYCISSLMGSYVSSLMCTHLLHEFSFLFDAVQFSHSNYGSKSVPSYFVPWQLLLNSHRPVAMGCAIRWLF